MDVRDRGRGRVSGIYPFTSLGVNDNADAPDVHGRASLKRPDGRPRWRTTLAETGRQRKRARPALRPLVIRHGRRLFRPARYFSAGVIGPAFVIF